MNLGFREGHNLLISLQVVQLFRLRWLYRQAEISVKLDLARLHSTVLIASAIACSEAMCVVTHALILSHEISFAVDTQQTAKHERKQ